MNDLIDATLLSTFLEVAQRGSVTKAARALHRSQPAISHRLRALEEELGVQLFEPVGRGLQLTDHGKLLREKCTDLVAQTRELRRAVRLDTPIAGDVLIGTLPTLAAHLLIDAVADLIDTHPGVRLTFAFDAVTSLHERLRKGDFDVIVVAAPPDPAFRYTVIHTTQIVAAMAPKLAPCGQVITVNELRSLRYLAWQGPDDYTFNRVRSYAEDNALTDPGTLRLPHMESLRSLCARNAGYTLLPEYVVRQDKRAGALVTREPVGLDTTIPITMMARTTAPWTPAIKAVWERMKTPF